MTTQTAQLDGSPARDTARWRDRMIVLAGVAIGGLLVVVALMNMGSFPDDPRPATAMSMRTINSAIKQYQLQHGELPPTLAVLTPKYLEDTPIDAWKRPFVYAPTSDSANPYTLYSTGASGKDVIDYWKTQSAR